TPIGRRISLVNDTDWTRLQRKEEGIAALTQLLRSNKHEGESLEKWLRRTEIPWEKVAGWCPEAQVFGPAGIEQGVLEAKYSGYIERQSAQVERFQRLESKPIPPHFDYFAIPQLRMEAKEKLGKIRPASLGQASRISGISPADLAVVMMYLQ